MPRRWTNGGSGGGSLKHRFVDRAPIMTCDYRVADEILARNAKIASKEAKSASPGQRRNSG